MKNVHKMTKAELIAEIRPRISWSLRPLERWSKDELQNEVRLQREERNEHELWFGTPENPIL